MILDVLVGHGMMVRFSRALKSLANDYNVAVLVGVETSSWNELMVNL